MLCLTGGYNGQNKVQLEVAVRGTQLEQNTSNNGVYVSTSESAN